MSNDKNKKNESFYSNHRKGMTWVIIILLGVVSFMVAIIAPFQTYNIKTGISAWNWANSIALFIGMMGIIFSIYNKYDSDEKFDKQIKHSEKQLKTQLTQSSKEKSLFKFVNIIMETFNKSYLEKPMVYAYSIDYYWHEKDQSHPFNSYQLIEIYNFFAEIFSKSEIYYYLPQSIKELIYDYNEKYAEISELIQNGYEELNPDKDYEIKKQELKKEELLKLFNSPIDNSMNNNSFILLSKNKDSFLYYYYEICKCEKFEDLDGDLVNILEKIFYISYEEIKKLTK